MMGWEHARNELNLEQARQKRREELAEDAAHRLVRALDLRMKQFVQALHDHNQWPAVSREVTEKERVRTGGLLFPRFEERTVTKTVTEPSHVLHFCRFVKTGRTYSFARNMYDEENLYELEISSNQKWALTRELGSDTDGGSGASYLVVKLTAEGTQAGELHELEIDLDALSNVFIKEMANHLMQRGLPLPQD